MCSDSTTAESLEVEFRVTYQLPPFDVENPYQYTRDRDLAFDIIAMLELDLTYKYNTWAVSKTGLNCNLAGDVSMLIAVFQAAINAYGNVQNTKLLYEHLHILDSDPKIVVTTATTYNGRYELYKIIPYDSMGGHHDIRQSFATLSDGLESLRVGMNHSRKDDDCYLYDRVTGLQYRIRD